MPDNQRTRVSGFNDTIVPVDYEVNGMIDSPTLHRHLVSRLPQNCTLTVIFDCCHSGSALELPYVYRTDEYGNVNLMDNLQMGYQLVGEASHLIQGGFSFQNVGEAAQLLGGAKDFFHSLRHQLTGEDGGTNTETGLAAASDFGEDWAREGKSVFMLSGCKDEQTSADAFIRGKHVGAMSWAFLETMKQDINWEFSFIDVCRLFLKLCVTIILTVSRFSIRHGSYCRRTMRRFRSFRAAISSI